MPRSYEIEVENKSGGDSSYIVTQEVPRVEGSRGPTWPLVISDAHVPPENTASFSIEIPRPHYAYSISTAGRPDHGNSVSVTQKLPVELGKQNDDGQIVRGSTLQYRVDNDMARMTDPGNPTASINAFEVVADRFTSADDNNDDAANKMHHLIGHGNADGPWTAFVAEPMTRYAITPTKVFYLTATSYSKGSIVDVSTFGQSLKIDFGELHGTVKVVHKPDGELAISSS